MAHFDDDGTSGVAGCQCSMGKTNLENIKKGETNRPKPGFAPVLIALLLLSQSSPAVANFTVKFTLEINSAAFESDGPGNYSPDVDPPDFLSNSAILLSGHESGPAKLNLTPASSDARVSIPGIRAPPPLT